MASHKNRSGRLIVSYSCKSGEHGAECDKFVAELDDVIVCHCDCHGPCGRQDCADKTGPQRKVRNSQVCGTCYEQLPLTGICNNCQ